MSIAWEGGEREELTRLGTMLDEQAHGGQPPGSVRLAAELLRVRSRSGRNVPLIANPVQLQYEAERRPANIVLKARQLGITTWVAGQFFLRTITRPGTMTVQVAHTQEAAQSIFRIVRRYLRCLPESLCRGALRNAQINARQIVFPGMDSEYRVETAGAPNAGRGLTITNLHCSEVARWPGDAAEILQGLRAALSPAGELVLESTPMGASGCFWKEWQDAETTGMVRHFFPWWLQPAYSGCAVPQASLDETEERLVREQGLSLEQIGYRRRIRKNFRGLAAQEYAEDPHACFLASGACIFDTAAIDGRMLELREPASREAAGNLHIWLAPVRGRDYLVSVDPAGGGTEGDFTAAQVIDLATGLQCAELRATLTPLEAAQEAAALARRYNNALLVVERNNHGAGVLAHLRGVCRYGRVYQEAGQDGWLTSAVTRPRILGRLGSALVESPGIFSSERLLRECRSFVRHANGRTEAQAGEHDDCLMAMAIALAVREERLTGAR
jgi:hypothetical protein